MNLIPAKIHLGIYGICVQDGKVLLIKKNRGPYKGLFDIPGGKIEPGETFRAALAREIDEETGLTLLEYQPLCVSEYHCVWESEGQEKSFHHVALYYQVKLDAGTLKQKPDGHDSDGAQWVAFPVAEEKIAPIARDALGKIHLKK